MMNIETIFAEFENTKNISEKNLNLIQSDEEIRKELCRYFLSNKNRSFAIKLLDTFVEIRKQPDGDMPAEDLMFANYILGLHQKVEDSIKIWVTKRTDFDSFCAVDIQLVVFSGVKETKEHLSAIKTDDAEDALNYIIECEKSGDFDNLNEYFDPISLPWYI